MKRMLMIFFLCLGMISLGYSQLQQEINHLITKLDANAYLGIELSDLNSGEILYQRNAMKPFIPASNMKLFSNAAALLRLGPDYFFTNELGTDATALTEGVLHGSVYLRLSGDPSFSHEHLKKMLSALRKWKITEIEGDFIIDSPLANVSPYAAGWNRKDFIYSYSAPMSPLILDRNRIELTINPNASLGGPAIIEILDPSKGIQIKNLVTTASKDKPCGVGFYMNKDNVLTVKGCMYADQLALIQQVAIPNPLLYAQTLIQSQLKRLHIRLRGKVSLGQAKKGALILDKENSVALSQLMADTLKFSDNLFADSLFLHTAAKLNGSPLNWEEAQLAVKTFLENETGLSLSTAKFFDGSGLSRHDQVTPHQTVALLTFLYQHFPLAYEYIVALPVSGRDGTLQQRFNKPDQQDLLRAKTGTLAGVSSLSGYLYAANGHTLAFAIFINRNNKVLPKLSGRTLIDRLCRFFLAQKNSSQALFSPEKPSGRIAFQSNPTQAELQRKRNLQWRGLERNIKQLLKEKNVTVLYRDNELVLKDNHPNDNMVYSLLQNIWPKEAFSLILSSKVMPKMNEKKIKILWMPPLAKQPQRLWTIREAF